MGEQLLGLNLCRTVGSDPVLPSGLCLVFLQTPENTHWCDLAMLMFLMDVLKTVVSCVLQDDVQTILHHQLLKQQQEEAQKKPKGFAVLWRSNKPLPQKPDYSTLAHTPVLTPQSPAATQRWKDKFRRGKIATQGPVESQPQMSDKEDNFQTVSLDWWDVSLIVRWFRSCCHTTVRWQS